MTTPFALKYQFERERWPYNRAEVRGRVPANRTGLYALWLPTGVDGGPDCLYVGKSETCLRRRLLQHLSNETNPKLRRELRLSRDIALFSVAFTESVEETRALEARLIRDWQPETNRTLL